MSLSENDRRRQLGAYGEMIALETFKRMGYHGRYLGHTFPCFDHELQKDGQVYLAAVRAGFAKLESGGFPKWFG
jgi:hypothetical protein